MGTEDEVFDLSHMLNFGEKLKGYGVQCEMIEAKGEGHAFDICAGIYGEVHVSGLLRLWVWALGGLVKLTSSFTASDSLYHHEVIIPFFPIHPLPSPPPLQLIFNFINRRLVLTPPPATSQSLLNSSKFRLDMPTPIRYRTT
jgi:hypothetical protein